MKNENMAARSVKVIFFVLESALAVICAGMVSAVLLVRIFSRAVTVSPEGVLGFILSILRQGDSGLPLTDMVLALVPRAVSLAFAAVFADMGRRLAAEAESGSIAAPDRSFKRMGVLCAVWYFAVLLSCRVILQFVPGMEYISTGAGASLLLFALIFLLLASTLNKESH